MPFQWRNQFWQSLEEGIRKAMLGVCLSFHFVSKYPWFLSTAGSVLNSEAAESVVAGYPCNQISKYSGCRQSGRVAALVSGYHDNGCPCSEAYGAN